MNWTSLAIAGSLRVSLIALLLLFGYPLLILPRRPGWRLADRLAAAGMTGLLFTVVAAHILIPLKLFEMLGFSLCLIALLLWFRYRNRGVSALTELVDRPLRWTFATLDRLTRSEAPAPGTETRRERNRSRSPWLRPSAESLLTAGALAVIAALTLAARLGDALASAAVTPSDFLIHLQWMKWLTMPGRGLFVDWVYPQGMNTVLATFRFFSQEEPQVLMRVAGPLFSLLIPFSLFYVVRSAAGSRLAAVAAAALYAAAPVWLPVEWSRQAATLPQEFAMSLLLPALWWSYRYLRDGDRLDQFLAAAAALVVAATHWLVLLYLAVTYAVAALTGLASLRSRESLARTLRLALWVGAATLAGLAPQLLALLSGKQLLPTAVAFAGEGTGQVLVHFRWDLLGALALLAALSLIRPRHGAWLLPGLLAGWAIVHLLPLAGVRSEAIATRSWDFLALASAAGLGGAWAGLERALPSAAQRLRPAGALGGAMALLLIVSALAGPVRVLRLEPELTHEVSLAVLNLKRGQSPGGWLLVGRSEVLPLVLGAGQQVDSGRFATVVSVPAAGERLADQLVRSPLLPPGTPPERAPELFLLLESSPHTSEAARSAGRQDSLAAETAQLREWVAQYTASHGEPEQYYHSPSLTIYRLTPLQR